MLTAKNIDNAQIKEAAIDVDGEKYVYIHKKDIPKNAEYGDVFIRDGCNYAFVKLTTLDRLRRLLHQCGQRSYQDGS